MKKNTLLSTISLIALTFSTVSFAAKANAAPAQTKPAVKSTAVKASTKSNVGCGLGTILLGDNDSLISQVCAATTNGTSANQTFGISSGTLGCETPKSITSNEKLQNFVAQNMDNLVNDISEGNGEYLDTLAVLLEVPQTERLQFNSRMQNNFSRIFTSDNIQSTEVVNNIGLVLQG
jgi:hypothetical protein